MKPEEILIYKEKENITKELVLDVANFCKCYVTKVCIKVIGQIEKISHNENIKHLLHELRIREEHEQLEFTNLIAHMISYEDNDIDPHNHCSTHADSYRNVLYDLLVR